MQVWFVELVFGCETLLGNEDIVADNAGIVESELVTRTVEAFDLEVAGSGEDADGIRRSAHAGEGAGCRYQLRCIAIARKLDLDLDLVIAIARSQRRN